MDPHMAANAQGDQHVRLVASIAMMNHQTRTCTARPATEAVALQHFLAHSTKESQGMILPIVARATAAEGFQLDRLFPARAQQRQLLPLLLPRRTLLLGQAHR